MLESYLSGHEGVVEAVAGRRSRYDDNGTLAVAAVERLHQVALLGLRGQTRRGTAALYVDDDYRQLGHYGQTHGLALERQARSRCGRHGEVAGIGGADGGADARDLVLGLHGLYTEILALGQLLEYDRRGGDGI